MKNLILASVFALSAVAFAQDGKAPAAPETVAPAATSAPAPAKKDGKMVKKARKSHKKSVKGGM